MRGFRSSCFWLALSLLLAACQQLPQVPQQSQRIIPLNHLPALQGDYFQLDSLHVGRAFHIYIRLPEGYDDKASTKYRLFICWMATRYFLFWQPIIYF